MDKAERLFNYKHDHWSNKMYFASTPQEKIDVAGLFAGTAVEAFCENFTLLSPAELQYFMKLIDQHAKRLVMPSAGILGGFRMTEDWLRCIIAKMALDGAEEEAEIALEKGDVETSRKIYDLMYEKLEAVWEKQGWNFEKSVHPVADRYHRTLTAKYLKDKHGNHGEIDIILVASCAVPIDSVWQSPSGRYWEIIRNTDAGFVAMDIEPPHRKMPFSETQILRWDRVE